MLSIREIAAVRGSPPPQKLGPADPNIATELARQGIRPNRAGRSFHRGMMLSLGLLVRSETSCPEPSSSSTDEPWLRQFHAGDSQILSRTFWSSGDDIVGCEQALPHRRQQVAGERFVVGGSGENQSAHRRRRRKQSGLAVSSGVVSNRGLDGGEQPVYRARERLFGLLASVPDLGAERRHGATLAGMLPVTIGQITLEQRQQRRSFPALSRPRLGQVAIGGLARGGVDGLGHERLLAVEVTVKAADRE